MPTCAGREDSAGSPAVRQESDRAANRLVDLEARAAREAAARAERSDDPTEVP
jgi:hypothetical protein